jgi:hypothetical protein
MVKYVSDGIIIKAYADYDNPSIRKNTALFSEVLDYKYTFIELIKDKIYKRVVLYANPIPFAIAKKSEIIYTF